MNVLPSQKLSIGQYFISIAAGLMLFLIPNDALNQFETDPLREGFIFIVTLTITAVLFFIVKRYEAIGIALITMSSMTALNLCINITKNFIANIPEGSYFPEISEYSIVSMFFLWFVPFMFAVIMRLISSGMKDNNEKRRSFSRFMTLSMKAFLIIYILVIIFKLIIPSQAAEQSDREIVWMIFSRISDCLNGTHEHGKAYIVWHCIIFAPIAFYLTVLVPKFKIWHIAIFAAAAGIAVEAMQYILNTAAACTDDILMYIVGALSGFLLKHGIDLLRSFLTRGQDPCMLSFEYTPIPHKHKGEAQVLTEE